MIQLNNVILTKKKMEKIEKEIERRYPINEVNSIDDAQHNFNVRMERIAFQEGYKHALEQVKNNGVLGDVIHGFFDWHKKQGYTELKSEDLDEYVLCEYLKKSQK